MKLISIVMSLSIFLLGASVEGEEQLRSFTIPLERVAIEESVVPDIELTKTQLSAWIESLKTCGLPEGDQCKAAFLKILDSEQRRVLNERIARGSRGK